MVTFKQKIILLLSLLVVIAGMWFFVPQQIKPEQKNQLIVGTCSGFPPYEVLDGHGVLVGFDIDVACALAARMNKKVVFKDMSYDALVLALKQGKIDLAIAGISITKTKLKEIALVHYQGTAFTSVPLIFWQHVPAGVQTIYDLQKLSNKTVCVQAGNIEEEILGEYTFLTLKQLDNISDLIMDIKYGKSIAACVDPEVAVTLKCQVPELVTIAVQLMSEQQTMGQGIGIAKNNLLLIAHVQKSIDQLKQDGTLAVFEKKWFNHEVLHAGN